MRWFWQKKIKKVYTMPVGAMRSISEMKEQIERCLSFGVTYFTVWVDLIEAFQNQYRNISESVNAEIKNNINNKLYTYEYKLYTVEKENNCPAQLDSKYEPNMIWLMNP